MNGFEKADYILEDGWSVWVEMRGGLEEYASNFLAIFNNVRDNPELISVSNDYGNRVQVVCDEESLKYTTKFLSQFGKIVEAEKTKIMYVSDLDIDIDYSKYDDIVVTKQD